MSKKDKIETHVSVDTKGELDKKESQMTEANVLKDDVSSREFLIFKRLGEIQEQIDEYDDLDKHRKELEKMYNQEESYFIKQKIKRMLSLPLDDLDIESKRIFINEHWGDICYEFGRREVIDSKTGEQITLAQINGLNPLRVGDISDSDIERYFNVYRKMVPYNYTTYERNRYEFFYDDKDIGDAYRMSKIENTFMYPSYYSRIAKRYCALYDGGKGTAIKFFELDDDVEQRISDRKLAEGDILTRDLEDIIIEVEDAIRGGDILYLTKYVYFRNGLPQSIRNDLDKKLDLSIPSDLDKKFFHEDEFRILLEKNKKDVKISNNPESLRALRNDLNSLLARRYGANAKDNQGFKLENLNLLRNIAKGYGHVLDRAYYWFEDYFRDRRYFPESLVKDFEKRFPINFEQYITSEFPYFDQSFLEDIEKTKAPIRNAFRWLGKEILKRIEEINEGRPELKEVSLDEILEKEGFNKESMGAKEYSTLIGNYTALMELETRRGIENEFNIQLNDFGFREQIQFVNFLPNKSEDDIIRVKAFLEQGTEPNERIKAFLSLEFEQDLSENLFTISENVDPKQADLIFARYAEIAELAYQAEREVLESVKDKEKVKKIDPRKISQDLLKRGKDILATFAQKIKESKDKGEGISTEEILSDLKDYHQDLVFTAVVIKEGKKEGLSFEDFEGAQFRVMSAREVFDNKDMFSQMCDMYRKNWKHEKPSFQAKLVQGFADKIEKGGEDVALFIFEKGGEVAAFSRSDRIGRRKRYFASLNVKPSMQGSAVGWALKEASVEIEGKENDIEADCDPTDSRSTPVYICKDGYVAIGAELNYAEEEKYVFKILRERNPRDYYFRGKSEAEVLEYHIKNNMGNKFNEGDELIVLKLEPGSEEMKKITDRLLNQEHYRITSYFFAEGGKVVYSAFERGGNAS